jgi:hypothetical protein
VSLYICLMHQGEVWKSIPKDATQISKGGGTRASLYRFVDGTTHLLRPSMSRRKKRSPEHTAKQVHSRIHKNNFKDGCPFCQPKEA